MVSTVLGHKSLKTTRHNAKITDKKVSEDMRALALAHRQRNEENGHLDKHSFFLKLLFGYPLSISDPLLLSCSLIYSSGKEELSRLLNSARDRQLKSMLWSQF